ncbi:MAG: PepSY-associated TM helix domain-containing protein [Pseudomonadota bacterium]
MQTPKPKNWFVRSLGAHSWLGLVVGAAMYWICLSGTLLVFHEDLGRWEQPEVDEFREYDEAALSSTFNTWFDDPARVTPHLWIILPTDTLPRIRFASETDSWLLNADGTVGPNERNAWTEMLMDLHLYLHLPKTWAMVLVSALGAMLVALIISGFFAHPKIIRDAFKLRLGGNRQLEQTDIHNRLSVWGAPFHLMIAVTGAYFGLALVIMGLYAQVFSDGDSQAIVADVFGGEPQLEQQEGGVAIDAALRRLKQLAPDVTPVLVTVHDAGTPNRFIEIYATIEGRLIYSENYVFDAQGEYLEKRGFSDGEPGKQMIYSIYRLHFGRFGGLGIKLLYGLLGLAITIVSATGINIWLAKRRARSWLDDLWVAVVWGAPVAILLSALAAVCFGWSPRLWFWVPYIVATVFALWLRDDRSARQWLQRGASVAALILTVAYSVTHPSSAVSTAVAGSTMVLGVMFAALSATGGPKTTVLTVPV